MKNIIAMTILGLLTSTFAYADGCSSLVNTSWTGQAKVISGKIVPIQVTVGNVSSVGNGFFQLAGTVNGEAFTNMFGCTETNPGVISGINFSTDTSSINGIQFSPDAQNPTKILALFGNLGSDFVDTSSDPSKNFLVKS